MSDSSLSKNNIERLILQAFSVVDKIWKFSLGITLFGGFFIQSFYKIN